MTGTLAAEDGATAVTHDANMDLRILDPSRVSIRSENGILRLILELDRCWLRVSVYRAFPFSDPNRYIAFVDGEGQEIGLIHDPAGLDPESRRMLAKELELRYFVPVVARVVAAKEEFGSVYWTVETDRGRAEIVVRNLRDNVHELPGGRTMITDVDGNRFEFPSTETLDPATRAILLKNL